MTAVIKAASKDHLFATWKDLLIAVWRGDTTLSGVQLGQHFFKEHMHAHAHAAGVLLLTVIESDAPAPGSQERAALGKLLDSGKGGTRRSAVVYEGTGFRAATVRSVVTGLSLFSRPPYPHKIFATVPDAAFFLCEGAPLGTAVAARELIDTVQEVRSRPLLPTHHKL